MIDLLERRERFVKVGPPDYYKMYLTLLITTSGSLTWKCDDRSGSVTLQRRINGGSWENWTSSTSGSSINVSVGDRIELKADAGTRPGSRYSWFNSSTYGASFEIMGNIASLVGYTPRGKESYGMGTSKLSRLFCGNKITSVENLKIPFTSVSENGLRGLFYSTNLVSVPEDFLPATTLKSGCYYEMFYNCISLKNGPTILPATGAHASCYYNMFYGCSSLISAPEICLNGSLASDSLSQMFYNCKKIDYIKCLARDYTTNTSKNWLYGVSSTGTFVKNSAVTSYTSGASGIPSGWTVINA